jgi:ankyrin repeat protein
VGCVRWLLDQGVPSVVCELTGQVKFPYSPLHIACLENAYGAAKAILEHGQSDVNVLSSDAETPLHLACSKNALELVQLLLEYNADLDAVNSLEETSLESAVRGCCVEVVKYFLSNNLPFHNTHFTPPRSVLNFCARRSESERTRLSQLIFRYPQFQSPQAVQENDHTGHSLLANAVQANKDDFVLELLHAGVSVADPHDDESAWSLLVQDPSRINFHSVGDPQQIRHGHIILQAFVDRLKEQGMLEARNDHGETLLYRAAFHRNVGAITVLLGAGASAGIANYDGLTPLHAILLGVFYMIRYETMVLPDGCLGLAGNGEPAKEQTVLTVLSLLLDAGVDPNKESCGGVMPIHIAVMAAWRLKSTAVVELLCTRGAQPDAPCRGLCGARPLHLALEALIFLKAWNLSCWWPLQHGMADEEVERRDTRYLGTVKGLVRVLSSAGAPFDALRQDMCEKNILFEAVWKCNPIGLRVMLGQDVDFYEALGTGQMACHYAVRWLETTERRRKLRQEPHPCQPAALWLKERKLKGRNSLNAVQEYLAEAQRVQELRVQEFETLQEDNGESAGAQKSSEISQRGKKRAPKAMAKLAKLWSTVFAPSSSI